MDSEPNTHQTRKQRNRKINKVLLPIIGGVFLLVIIIIIAGNAASKKSSTDTLASSTAKSSAPSSSSTSNPTTTPTITATPVQGTPVAIPSPTTTTPAPSTPSCYTTSQAASEEGQTGCVQFTGYAYTSDSGQMYLDQYASAPYGFSVWIPAGTSGGSTWLNEYSGQNIDITGTITNYDGEPEIEVTTASQIQTAS